MSIYNIQDTFNDAINEYVKLIADENKEAKELLSTFDEFDTLQEFYTNVLNDMEEKQNHSEIISEAIDKYENLIKIKNIETMKLKTKIKRAKLKLELLSKEQNSFQFPAEDLSSSYKKRLKLSLLHQLLPIHFNGNVSDNILSGFTFNKHTKTIQPFNINCETKLNAENQNELWQLYAKNLCTSINEYERLFMDPHHQQTTLDMDSETIIILSDTN